MSYFTIAINTFFIDLLDLFTASSSIMNAMSPAPARGGGPIKTYLHTQSVVDAYRNICPEWDLYPLYLSYTCVLPALGLVTLISSLDLNLKVN